MFRSKISLLLVFLLLVTGGYAQSHNPLKGITIMLDPGHGGADPGAVGPTGLKESDVNLRVARYLMMLLEADGARVIMTRETDVFLSLGQRIEKAQQHSPDLFVSIHHNASLSPVTENRSEVYFNAMDHGISRKVSEKMMWELFQNGFGEESVIIPGGFFVLRNNPSPAVLTEGSYITIPKIEKQLMTGKALTDQAQALRQAIKDAFSEGALKVKVYASKSPVKVDTPYINLIFSSNKDISRVHARLSPDSKTGFAFNKIPAFGPTYRFYNTEAITSGEYELQMTFYAKDGTVAPRKTLSIHASLPVANSTLTPVAPYIPTGFRGNFPLEIVLRDQLGRNNHRSVPVALISDNAEVSTGLTNSAGKGIVLLNLTGDEQQSVQVRAVIEGEIVAETSIPIQGPVGHFVLGRVFAPSGEGLEGVRIDYGGHATFNTSVDGFFYLEFPKVYNNLNLNLKAPLGYQSTTHWIRTAGEPVVLPHIRIEPVAPALLGKTIGIIAPPTFDASIRRLVRKLMTAGAKVRRFNLPDGFENPYYQAVLEANLTAGLDLVLSFRRETAGPTTLRYFHRGGRGKRIAQSLAASLADSKYSIIVKHTAGSDYEINHTGATALVLDFPKVNPPNFLKAIVDNLYKVLQDNY